MLVKSYGQSYLKLRCKRIAGINLLTRSRELTEVAVNLYQRLCAESKIDW